MKWIAWYDKIVRIKIATFKNEKSSRIETLFMLISKCGDRRHHSLHRQPFKCLWFISFNKVQINHISKCDNTDISTGTLPIAVSVQLNIFRVPLYPNLFNFFVFVIVDFSLIFRLKKCCSWIHSEKYKSVSHGTRFAFMCKFLNNILFENRFLSLSLITVHEKRRNLLCTKSSANIRLQFHSVVFTAFFCHCIPFTLHKMLPKIQIMKHFVTFTRL